MRWERNRIRIVRCSLDYALTVERNGGKIQPMENGTAEVITAEGNCYHYLNRADYKKYLTQAAIRTLPTTT